ncbi:YhgE/Pip domain-containing protein [Candidatus Mycobacterium methanotrophicum]|uniref:YhgE/Pip domain-containing protein n=1 Tax=Candidatus Mycobacterium methanotrophicum TaxID=2943498 RepID=A0ABY4QIM5_9MYCO|nr:YhgE/Pip domain-containing protein [Candidatus Mycobacterium methanotrophicum]UQX10880.1 YhgE/Pip domain-containing protein [Candidatus Mycobacterium methanotrophicum]
MSESQPRHAVPGAEAVEVLPHPDDILQSGLANPKATRTVRFWAIPIVITLTVLAALAAFYLGGILRPMTNLRHFPIAVVDEDAGPTGAQVVKGLLSGFEKDDAYDVRVLTRDQAKHQLDTGQVYGVAVIPPNFSSTLQAFAKSALTPGRVERPIIVVSTNPRAGALGASIANQSLTRAITMVDHRVGERLSQEVAQQSGPRPMPAAVTLMLRNPIEVQPTVHNALPDGTGNGLSAFYYSLLLLLAGFTGSIVVSMLVDSMLGFVPAEVGPVYRFAEQVKISRLRTLLIKWALMTVLALLTSGVYMLIAARLGMPIHHSLQLWLYGVFAIAAVGITSTSLIAVLGALGLLVSMFVFVILGLPSAGATVPLEAAPQFFGWLAKFEPMHQVFLGARSLLYFDGQADAGLSQALTMTAIGLVIGVLLGAVVTWIYDRRGYHRTPPWLEASAPSE